MNARSASRLGGGVTFDDPLELCHGVGGRGGVSGRGNSSVVGRGSEPLLARRALVRNRAGPPKCLATVFGRSKVFGIFANGSSSSGMPGEGDGNLLFSA